MKAEPAIAILAKAPIPGLAKTRLIPAIGAHAAAVLQERLTERTIETAIATDLGLVTLWGTPDVRHASFRTLAARFPIALFPQPDGDLGARMLAAIAAVNGPVLLLGTDCPALTPAVLRAAAEALRDTDAVAIPASDGGYALIGLHQPVPELFNDMAWGTAGVMEETRRRAETLGLRVVALETLWDVDLPDDLDRMEREYPELAL